MLGLRLIIVQVVAHGWQPVMVVAISLVLTLCVLMLVARLMGFNMLFGPLSGGATDIRGASAALALSADLPPHPRKERATLLTIIGVSVLSTITMVFYPLLARCLGRDAHPAGVFLGASIHDVAR